MRTAFSVLTLKLSRCSSMHSRVMNEVSVLIAETRTLVFTGVNDSSGDLSPVENPAHLKPQTLNPKPDFHRPLTLNPKP